MGKESLEKPIGYDETQAHNISSGQKENRGGTAGTMGKGPCEESGLGPSDSGRKNDTSHLQTEEKVYAACDCGGKTRPRPGDYPIGAVITRLIGKQEVVIASAGNRVKTSGSSIKHVELETLKYVSSGYGRYLPDFVLYSTHEPCVGCRLVRVGDELVHRWSVHNNAGVVNNLWNSATASLL